MRNDGHTAFLKCPLEGSRHLRIRVSLGSLEWVLKFCLLNSTQFSFARNAALIAVLMKPKTSSADAHLLSDSGRVFPRALFRTKASTCGYYAHTHIWWRDSRIAPGGRWPARPTGACCLAVPVSCLGGGIFPLGMGWRGCEKERQGRGALAKNYCISSVWLLCGSWDAGGHCL